MKILERLRNRSDSESIEDPGPPADEHQGVVPGYDRMDDKEVGERLPQLSQVELAAVEAHERDHRNRPEVLNKLRYMRTAEPLPDYDTLSSEEIVKELATADAEEVKAVRDYERKFKRRARVLDEAASVLPEASPSAGEARRRNERSDRVHEGVADRDNVADELAARPSSP
jgi:hypothetical protein